MFPFFAICITFLIEVLFFSYLGFAMVSSLAEEVKRPERTVPKGIIGSLLISAII